MKLIRMLVINMPLVFFVSTGVIHAKEVQQKFMAADTNKDEKLSKDEVVVLFAKRAGKKGAETFTKLDANNDFSITKDEVKGKKAVKKMGLQNADTDDNGKLSKEEVVVFFEKKAEQKAGTRFAQIDTNDDGFLTPEEIKQARQKGKKKEVGEDTESEDEPL